MNLQVFWIIICFIVVIWIIDFIDSKFKATSTFISLNLSNDKKIGIVSIYLILILAVGFLLPESLYPMSIFFSIVLISPLIVLGIKANKEVKIMNKNFVKKDKYNIVLNILTTLVLSFIAFLLISIDLNFLFGSYSNSLYIVNSVFHSIIWSTLFSLLFTTFVNSRLKNKAHKLLIEESNNKYNSAFTCFYKENSRKLHFGTLLVGKGCFLFISNNKKITTHWEGPTISNYEIGKNDISIKDRLFLKTSKKSIKFTDNIKECEIIVRDEKVFLKELYVK